MIKLKQLLEFSVPGSMTSGDTELRPWITETHKDGWFVRRKINDFTNNITETELTLNENGKKHKITIEIITRNLRKPHDTHSSYENRVNNFTHKIAKSWATSAKKLHDDPKEITECGNKKMRTWLESFEEALNSPKVSGYAKKKKETAPTMDGVNFTNVI